MEVVKKYFPEILSDNDMTYFAKLEGIIESIDELSSLQITRNTNTYQFRLAPSHPKYTTTLFQELINFHNLYSIRLNLSKSIKSTGTISFEITI
jgi:hypothetical protein